MSNGRSDALALLRVWFETGTLVRCEFRFARFAACFRGRIRDLSDERVELFSDDTRGELVLPLGPDVTVGLGEFSKPLPPDDAAEYGRIVSILLPCRLDEEPDQIAFIHVKE